ncbi:MAG: hypothetical protein ACXVW7_08290 [Trebonia sp.]
MRDGLSSLQWPGCDQRGDLGVSVLAVPDVFAAVTVFAVLTVPAVPVRAVPAVPVLAVLTVPAVPVLAVPAVPVLAVPAVPVFAVLAAFTLPRADDGAPEPLDVVKQALAAGLAEHIAK